MISEAEFKSLLAHKGETRNLDFKAPLSWRRASNDEQCELVKDILAFLNTENGGVIIFGVRDATLERIGLTEDECASFDVTRVNDFLHRYTDPISSCQVQKFVVDSRRFVAIEVPEFNDVPVICKRDANSSKNSSKVIVRAGGLYVRTDKATSELINSAEAMRDLIGRALLKRPDLVFRSIDPLIQSASRIQQQSLDAEKRARKQLRDTLRQLEQSYDITLEALSDALDTKISSNAGHSKCVTAYTIAIAKTMGLPSDAIHVIARGAFLHDIGKIAIPDAILKKPGKLDPAEFTIMREHCLRGYKIVKKIPFLAGVDDIVYAHHENFDGTGYPRGLKGDEIPLGSRIVAIANTLDTMTSDQPYRSRQPLLAAIEEIGRCSGSQFDPEIVKVFLSMPEHIWVALRQDIEGYPRAL